MIPVEEVALMCERAYRRGYQQGYTLGEEGIAPRVDLWSWRFETPAQKAICPDTGKAIFGVETSLKRLQIEEVAYFEKACSGG